MGYDLIKGALIGSFVGSIAGLLLAPKSGQELYQDLLDGYNTLNARGSELSQNIKERGRSLLHPFQAEEEEEGSNQALLIGGAIAAVIAAIATLLLTPASGNKIRSSLGDTYGDLIQKAGKFISTLNSKGGDMADEISDWKDSLVKIVNKLQKGKIKGNSTLNHLLDYAGLGLQLFQQLQGRK